MGAGVAEHGSAHHRKREKDTADEVVEAVAARAQAEETASGSRTKATAEEASADKSRCGIAMAALEAGGRSARAVRTVRGGRRQ